MTARFFISYHPYNATVYLLKRDLLSSYHLIQQSLLWYDYLIRSPPAPTHPVANLPPLQLSHLNNIDNPSIKRQNYRIYS